MSSLVLQQLDIYGPDRCDKLDYDKAVAFTHDLVRAQYENFTVISWLLPKRLRDHFANVYAFCRWADDLGDETGDRDRSLELLAWWRKELQACYNDQPRHPVFVALLPTIKQCDIPIKPFDDLIKAFEQDQRIVRYQNWDQVVDYCTRSADPVGRLVLYLCGYRDEERQQLSDRTCTALQLANFWQDVRRDILERDRIYVPGDELAKNGLTHDDLVEAAHDRTPLSPEKHAAYAATIKGLVDKTWPLFKEGHGLWPMIARDVRYDIQLFSLGGEAIMRLIERGGYHTLDRRPKLNKFGKAKLMGRALFGKMIGLIPIGGKA